MKLALHRNWILLAAALALGLLSAFGVKRYIEQHVEEMDARNKPRLVRVVVPKQDLLKGAVLSADLLAVREVPADWAHTNAVTPEQFNRIEGQRLAYPVSGGEMLMWALLEGQRAPSFSARLPAGQRAITVPVDDVNSISGMLQPGDRIDLMVSARKDTKTYLFPLMQNVSVLATGSQAVPGPASDGKDGGGKRTYTTITLEASPEDARRVLAAREIGKLAAMLRAPGDQGQVSSSRRDALALIGLGDAGKEAEATVPVIYGGRSGAAKPIPKLGARSEAEALNTSSTPSQP